MLDQSKKAKKILSICTFLYYCKQPQVFIVPYYSVCLVSHVDHGTREADIPHLGEV
jgi:hypothetical protein